MRSRRTRATTRTQHYLRYKEYARAVVHVKLAYWNQLYGFRWRRVAIRNQRTCWGSCSSAKNLNFNYKIAFLPARLQDYLIVHELCHLREFNHSPAFWELVARALPHWPQLKRELDRHSFGGRPLSAALRHRGALHRSWLFYLPAPQAAPRLVRRARRVPARTGAKKKRAASRVR